MDGFRIALVTLILLLTASPVAEAQVYEGASHYRLTVPDDWIKTTVPRIDVAFAHPDHVTNLNVVVFSDSSARSTLEWLLQAAQAAYPQVLAQFPGTIGIQLPRSFTSGSGRPAADYVIDYDLSGSSFRIRQVLFASDFWDRGYILTFTSLRDVYDFHEQTWSTAVDTFTVLGEGAAFATVALAALSGAVIAGTIAAAFVLVRRRKKVLPIIPGVPPTPPSGAPSDGTSSPPPPSPPPGVGP